MPYATREKAEAYLAREDVKARKREYARQRRANNPEREKASKADYYKRRKERTPGFNKQYYEQVRERPQWLRYNLCRLARNRAQRYGIPFASTPDDIEISTHCPALGIKLEPGRGKMQEASPTLDRIIPRLGYIPGNVIVISARANRIKADATPDEMLRIMRFARRMAAQHTAEEATA